MTSELPRLLTADALREAALRAADSRIFRAEVLRRLQAMIEFDWYVWALTDPVTGVGIDPVARIPDIRDAARAIRLKYLTATNRWTTLDTAAALGDRAPESPLWRELQEPAGVVDVASVVLREHGNCWGFLDLWSRHPVSPEQVTMLRGVAPGLAEAVRLLRGRTFHGPAQPSFDTWPVRAAARRRADGRSGTPQSRSRCCDSSCRRPRISSPVPAAVYNVAAQLLAREAGIDHSEPLARMPASDGSWVRVSAARVDPAGGIAVTIEPTTMQERLELFARAHALSNRERDIVRELSTGAATAEIAERLFVSPYTVQDHLKAVFEKTGVHSRKALLARATGA